jgi:hypothetical protein
VKRTESRANGRILPRGVRYVTHYQSKIGILSQKTIIWPRRTASGRVILLQQFLQCAEFLKIALLDLEVLMPVTVVLAVGLDSWLLSAQSAVWKSAGFIVIPVNSIKAAIDHFRVGDFDLVLLGHSFPIEIKERLTFLIKASGSRTPVVCLSHSCGDCNGFADATLGSDPNQVLNEMKELMARTASLPAVRRIAYSGAA